ncbi:MAG: hypothetical protein JWL83_3183 [Actinomycetia bacterium]|nr:hypothetical protein [Actinomycetes bacterium]
MAGVSHNGTVSIDLVRLGAFSGSATSLRDALRRRVVVADFDLQRAARDWRSSPARARALAEAQRCGAGVAAWPKSAAWSRALERWYARTNPRAARATIVVQSIPAFTEFAHPYAVYTDRVGREGMAEAGSFRSHFTPGWLAREQTFLERAACVYTMGPSTRDVIIDQYGLPPGRVRVVASGSNVPMGPMAAPTVDCRRVLFVGNDWERKGGPELLEAFAAVRARHPALELEIVGSSPDRVPAGVRVLGRVPHAVMYELFSRADLFVVPTRAEPFGIALAEALMAGVPGVGSTVGNQQWILGDGGETVPPGDAPALAETIERMITDYPAYRARARARGEELRAEFSWDRVADVMLADFEAQP